MWFAKIQWWLSIEFCREPFLLPKKYMGKTPCFRARNPIWKWHLKETPQKNTVTETIKKLFFLMASWAEQPTTLGSQSGANVYQLSGAPICASLGWHHPVDANCSVVNSIPSYEHQLRKWCFWNFTLPPSVSFYFEMPTVWYQFNTLYELEIHKRIIWGSPTWMFSPGRILWSETETIWLSVASPVA